MAGIPRDQIDLKDERERRFVYAWVTQLAADQTDAARMAGYAEGSNNSLRVTAHRVRNRPRVVEAIEEVARATFGSMLPRVIHAAAKLIDDPTHRDHAKTVISLLSKYFGDRASVDVKVSGEVEVNHTARAVEDLRAAIALRFSREQLIEAFGESGLAKYEKLLGNGPKVIEHQPAAPVSAVEEPKRGICD